MSAVRKTLTYLGLIDSEEETTHEDNMLYLTPARKMSQRYQQDSNAVQQNIVTVHPTKYSDARQVAENYREGSTVIMDVTNMPQSEARRIIDFCSGLTIGLHGTIQRITATVFLLAPANTNVIEDSENQDAAKEFFSVNTNEIIYGD